MTEKIYVQHIPEQVVPGRRLGRHVHHDSRSLRYLYSGPVPAQPKPVLWTREAPILDQGDLGSCTGNAIVGALATNPDFGDLPTGHPALDEALAVRLYSAATALDDYPGAYPPDDTGSDGLSACKAAQQAGLLSGYTHCISLAMMRQALQAGPVIVGVNWYDSFDKPASSGEITISPNAQVRGGHEFVVRGDDSLSMLFADNSWDGWGPIGGSMQLSYTTMERLLAEQGDCTVPVPASLPAPVPTPTPVPVADARSALMWQRVSQWASARHTLSNKAAAAELRSWAHDEGLI